MFPKSLEVSSSVHPIPGNRTTGIPGVPKPSACICQWGNFLLYTTVWNNIPAACLILPKSFLSFLDNYWCGSLKASCLQERIHWWELKLVGERLWRNTLSLSRYLLVTKAKTVTMCSQHNSHTRSKWSKLTSPKIRCVNNTYPLIWCPGKGTLSLLCISYPKCIVLT